MNNFLMSSVCISLTVLGMSSSPVHASCKDVRNIPTYSGTHSQLRDQYRVLASTLDSQIEENERRLAGMDSAPSDGGGAGRYLLRQSFFQTKLVLEQSKKDAEARLTCYRHLADRFNNLVRYRSHVDKVILSRQGLADEASWFGWREFLESQANFVSETEQLSASWAHYFNNEFLKLRNLLNFDPSYPHNVLRYAALILVHQFPAAKSSSEVQRLFNAWRTKLAALQREGVSVTHVEELQRILRHASSHASKKFAQ